MFDQNAADEEDIFTNFTVGHIEQHDAKSPLLAFHAAHSIHTPLEVVPDAFEHFSFIHDSVSHGQPLDCRPTADRWWTGATDVTGYI